MGWGQREKRPQTAGTTWGGDSLREWVLLGKRTCAEEAGPAVGGQMIQEP